MLLSVFTMLIAKGVTHDNLGYLLEPVGIHVVKCGQFLAVDVEHAQDSALAVPQGHNYLAA